MAMGIAAALVSEPLGVVALIYGLAICAVGHRSAIRRVLWISLAPLCAYLAFLYGVIPNVLSSDIHGILQTRIPSSSRISAVFFSLRALLHVFGWPFLSGLIGLWFAPRDVRRHALLFVAIYFLVSAQFAGEDETLVVRQFIAVIPFQCLGMGCLLASVVLRAERALEELTKACTTFGARIWPALLGAHDRLRWVPAIVIRGSLASVFLFASYAPAVTVWRGEFSTPFDILTAPAVDSMKQAAEFLNARCRKSDWVLAQCLPERVKCRTGTLSQMAVVEGWEGNPFFPRDIYKDRVVEAVTLDDIRYVVITRFTARVEAIYPGVQSLLARTSHWPVVFQREGVIIREGAAPRRPVGRRAQPPLLPAAQERGTLSKRREPNEGRQGGERPASVPPVDTVVPGEPDRLRARAGGGHAEPEAMPRAVEEPRAQVQAAELSPERTALDGARVTPEAPVPARACGDDGVGGEHSVLEREGDALAHERIAPGRIPGEERARRGDPCAGRPGADGERLPRPRPRADARQLGSQLGLETRAVHRREPVDADVRVRHAVDDAGERPAVAAEACGARREVELVTARGVTVPAGLGERHVGHDGARHHARAVAHERAAHHASASVGTDDDGRPVRAAIRLDAHACAVAREVHDALAWAARERGVGLAPADDAAEVAAGDGDGATARDRHSRAIHARVRNGERDTELLGQAERLRDHPAGAGLVAGMVGLVEEDRAGGEIGCPGREPERRRRPGRSRADDDDLAPLHAGALSAPGQRAPPPERAA